MKIRSLIKKLQHLEDKHGNLEVIVDFEGFEDGSHGYYNLEKAHLVKHKGDAEDRNEVTDFYINLQSSNEA